MHCFRCCKTEWHLLSGSGSVAVIIEHLPKVCVGMAKELSSDSALKSGYRSRAQHDNGTFVKTLCYEEV